MSGETGTKPFMVILNYVIVSSSRSAGSPLLSRSAAWGMPGSLRIENGSVEDYF